MSVDDATVLSAAFEAFAEQGYDAMSVREVARELGVSHNTIPQRFGRKERLWTAAVDEVLGEMSAELVAALGDAPPAGVERLRAMMRTFVVHAGRRPSALRLITTESQSPGPRLDHLMDRLVVPVVVLAQTLLTDLHRAGSIRTDDVTFVYFTMVHAAAGPLLHPALYRRLGGRVPADDDAALQDWADTVVELILGGLVTDSSA